MFYFYSFEIKLGVHDTVWILQSAILNRWRVLGWPVVFFTHSAFCRFRSPSEWQSELKGRGQRDHSLLRSS